MRHTFESHRACQIFCFYVELMAALEGFQIFLQ